MSRANIHGTAIVLGDRGILVLGRSGAGKTTLALTLLDHFASHGLFSRLVADDRLFVALHAGRLVCRTPDSIAGLVEVPGIGPRPIPSMGAAVVDLCVRLVPQEAVERFQEDLAETIAGCSVPLLHLPERNAVAAMQAVAARFGLAPFG